ncbi:MAG: hypothetical protein LBN39_06000 [Planctomycetaceae bacterium]|jgi:hypothetical protein|nr:hypothetical protein [Planctomycetaceae bacterium]
MRKSLDVKLARILSDRSCSDFILADAKDADMAYGLSAPGQSPEQYGHEGVFRTLDEYRDQIRAIITQGLVDIVLMSASTNEILTIREKRFENSAITPAIRANDTTDIWLAGAEGVYGREPSRWFRTATLDHAMCGKEYCKPEERKIGADLGLYSITYNNDLELDREALFAYKEFRIEAEHKGFRHFLEVFSPNISGTNTPKDIPAFVNNHIVRTLAGVTSKGRPVFLKIPYYGPAAMEALARYDSEMIVGILGGSAGTTLDAFQMLYDAKKYGARVALYGRKINNAEHQLSFVKYLRLIADGQILPIEATKAYHGDLQKLNIKPRRSPDKDLERMEMADSYSGQSGQTKKHSVVNPPHFDNKPDFAKMSAAEKIQWNLDRLTKVFG